MNTIDIVCCVLLILFALIGFKNGLAKSLLRFAGNIFAAVIARAVAGPVAGYVYESFLRERVILKMNELFPSGVVTVSLDEQIKAVKEALPEGAYSIAKFFDFIPETHVSGKPVMSVTEAEAAYLQPILTKVLVIITIIVLFIILSVILLILANIINKYCFENNKNSINKANRVFGGIFGIVRGLIPIAICCLILNVVSPLIANDTLTELVTGSIFCSFIAGAI
jgi:uncharacterized membrane protein required for colicin V production